MFVYTYWYTSMYSHDHWQMVVFFKDSSVEKVLTEAKKTVERTGKRSSTHLRGPWDPGDAASGQSFLSTFDIAPSFFLATSVG